LGYFLLSQFSPKQLLSTHGLLWVFSGLKSGFDVDLSGYHIECCCRYSGIIGYFFHKLDMKLTVAVDI
jgi:hypothetical protein